MTSERRRRWIWGGRIVAVVLLVGIGIWMAFAGLERANALAGAIGLLVAIAALVAPYLLPLPPSGPTGSSEVEGSGKARAETGGQANTGISTQSSDRPSRVSNSGDAVAKGPGSIANTGIND